MSLVQFTDSISDSLGPIVAECEVQCHDSSCQFVWLRGGQDNRIQTVGERLRPFFEQIATNFKGAIHIDIRRKGLERLKNGELKGEFRVVSLIKRYTEVIVSDKSMENRRTRFHKIEHEAVQEYGSEVRFDGDTVAEGFEFSERGVRWSAPERFPVVGPASVIKFTVNCFSREYEYDFEFLRAESHDRIVAFQEALEPFFREIATNFDGKIYISIGNRGLEILKNGKLAGNFRVASLMSRYTQVIVSNESIRIRRARFHKIEHEAVQGYGSEVRFDGYTVAEGFEFSERGVRWSAPERFPVVGPASLPRERPYSLDPIVATCIVNCFEGKYELTFPREEPHDIIVALREALEPSLKEIATNFDGEIHIAIRNRGLEKLKTRELTGKFRVVALMKRYTQVIVSDESTEIRRRRFKEAKSAAVKEYGSEVRFDGDTVAEGFEFSGQRVKWGIRTYSLEPVVATCTLDCFRGRYIYELEFLSEEQGDKARAVQESLIPFFEQIATNFIGTIRIAIGEGGLGQIQRIGRNFRVAALVKQYAEVITSKDEKKKRRDRLNQVRSRAVKRYGARVEIDGYTVAEGFEFSGQEVKWVRHNFSLDYERFQSSNHPILSHVFQSLREGRFTRDEEMAPSESPEENQS